MKGNLKISEPFFTCITALYKCSSETVS